MKVLTCDLAELHNLWMDRGWVHIPGAVHPELIEHLCYEIAKAPKHGQVPGGASIEGEKARYVYDPPDGPATVAALREAVARLSGTNAGSLTLSERHLEVYLEDADPDPPAHNDRRSSQVSVSISVEVPPGSSLLVYPETDVGENPFLDAGLRTSLEPFEMPEVILAGAPAVVIRDSPGDLIAITGSSMWHRRANASGSAHLCLKFNDFGCDPLGEDLRHAGTPAPARPVLSPAVEWFGVLQGHGGFEQPMVKVWDASLFPITSGELAFLTALRSGANRGSLPTDYGDPAFSVDRLVRRGVVVL